MPMTYLGTANPRVNSTTSDPLVTSDTSAGYRVGDIWVNTTTKVAFELVDATAGAAVWVLINGQSHPGYVAGRYYHIHMGAANGTLTLTENRLYFMPFFASRTLAVDRLGFAITTGAGAAQNEVRTGIYKTTIGRPGSLLVDNGRTVIGTGTGNTAVTISQNLAPGWYWLAIISNRAPSGSATQPTLRSWTTEARTTQYHLFGAVGPDVVNESTVSVFNDETVADWTTYTLPTTATSSITASSQPPALWLRAA